MLGDVAFHAASLAGVSAADTLTGLASWATERIAVLATIDPESYATMSSSLEGVVGGLQSVLEQDASNQAFQYTNALVLGVQQLVTTLRSTDGGNLDGVTIEAMMAAQEAVAKTLKVRCEAGDLDEGCAEQQVFLK